MTFRLDVESRAEPAAVLAAIAAELREWRESALPSELRKQGATRVVGQVDGARFRLRYAFPFPERGRKQDFTSLRLRGTVVARAGGGSRIAARCGRTWVLATGAACTLLLVAGWMAAHGHRQSWSGAFLLLLLFAIVGPIRDRNLTRDDRAADWLAGRLEHAVAVAEKRDGAAATSGR